MLYTRELAQSMGIAGELFRSKKEAKTYIVRLEQEFHGTIRNLRRGKRERIQLHTVGPAGEIVKVTTYEPDFLYDEQVDVEGSWRPVVEDVKGWRQDIYNLKKRWVEAEYRIVIRES